MKKHETLEALVSNDETFVITKGHLHTALMLIHHVFPDEYAAQDLMGRRSIAGAALTFAMELPFEEARKLFVNDQELHKIIDLVVAGYDAVLALDADAS